ncbi:type I 3-dehydroquinate dehydratase [Oscillospiraceae bacterium HV4-5-C5C]|nr:type I 3-dehydroquinate dehydratase [Oscillospiraceae bacterium HV4-5-C5C]
MTASAKSTASTIFCTTSESVEPRRTAIIVPLMGRNLEQLTQELGELQAAGKSGAADCLEWRLDHFDRAFLPEACQQARLLISQLSPLPLIITYRTDGNPGLRQRLATAAAYSAFILDHVLPLKPSWVDIEYSWGPDTAAVLLSACHQKGSSVILSYHDFDRTPAAAELDKQFQQMTELPADITKIVTTAASESDYRRLLMAGQQAVRLHPSRACIFMAMGEAARVSRFLAASCGSAAVFASLVTESAAGQPQVGLMRSYLDFREPAAADPEACVTPVPSRIYLTGFMGSGKSTLGALLAELLGYQFTDTDDLVCQLAGQTIPQIFSQAGETAFRMLEQQALQETGRQAEQVIATGGGIVLNPANRRFMRQHGCVIHIDITAAEVYRRIRGDQNRPILAQLQTPAEIEQLLQARQTAYLSDCDFTVQADDRSVSHRAWEVLIYLFTPR